MKWHPSIANFVNSSSIVTFTHDCYTLFSMETKSWVQSLGLCDSEEDSQSSVECRGWWLIGTPTTAIAPECQVTLMMLGLIRGDQNKTGKCFIFSLISFNKLLAGFHMVTEVSVEGLIVHLPFDPCLHPKHTAGTFDKPFHVSLLPGFASDWQCNLFFLNHPVATYWYLPYLFYHFVYKTHTTTTGGRTLVFICMLQIL